VKKESGVWRGGQAPSQKQIHEGAKQKTQLGAGVTRLGDGVGCEKEKNQS